jgi:D-beta-D-heptose 7-phosphate kinase/D-beta-D-heptose 1-phosphate adenosyltransferase
MISHVLSLENAVRLVDALRAAHRTVVFTNGVYDILHPGHVRYLQAARAEGDALIVGINSDRSVRANKGPDRPINPEAERAEVVAALASVDAVVIFDEDTPHRIITCLQPDVLVKGADWPADQIVGRDVVEARGGRVVRATNRGGPLDDEHPRADSRRPYHIGVILRLPRSRRSPAPSTGHWSAVRSGARIRRVSTLRAVTGWSSPGHAGLPNPEEGSCPSGEPTC